MCQLLFMVRVTGLEPVRRETHAPQTCLSAYSSTLAFIRFLSVSQLNNQDYIIRHLTSTQKLLNVELISLIKV